MDRDKLCMGCLQERGDTSLCQHCGYEEGTVPESPLFLPPRTILEKKYLIGRVLGQGGFGITYLAWDLNLNIKLAIKEYFPQNLASRAAGHTQVSAFSGSLGGQYEYGLDKFLQEARTLARFEGHPNIVSIRDFFKANGTAYFVMNYVEGVTLKEYLAKAGGTLPPDQARAIIMPVMDALREVHSADILHRDISPDNIFINEKGQITLLDFGAARQAIGEAGHSLSIILKPGYAPEEQYRSKGHQGPWTDIYAVAATYYHLLTGIRPPESLERLTEDNLQMPVALGVDISAGEEEILLRAMAVRASDRYQDVKEFQEAILAENPDMNFSMAETIRREVISTPVPGDTVKTRKPPLVLVAALAAVLIIGAGVYALSAVNDTAGEPQELEEEPAPEDPAEETPEETPPEPVADEEEEEAPEEEDKEKEEAKDEPDEADETPAEEKEEVEVAATEDPAVGDDPPAADSPPEQTADREGSRVSIQYDGGTYTGALLDGLPHGQGTWTHPSGDRYEGGWRLGSPQGYGSLRVQGEYTYDGEFRDGVFHGKGTLVFNNGGSYTGDFLLGQAHGWGKEVFPNGDIYEGQYQRDMFHGQGTYTFADGTALEGRWRNGEFLD